MGQITEPTRSTREFLRAKAGTNAKLRKLLKGVSKKQKREAIARAASGTTPPLPVASTRAVSNTLGMSCACGKSVSVPCASVGDILDAHAKLAEGGWGYDERGNVRCPDCLGKPTVAPAPASEQLDLVDWLDEARP